MKYLIYDIQHMPLWLSGTLVLLYVALFAYFVYIIVHYGRKHNCFLLPIVMVGLGLSACTSVTDTPVVAPVSTMQLTVNGLSYDINLATTDTVNLRALSVEFPAQFSVANHSRFANLTIGGKPVVGGTCSLQIDTISHRHHIELCYTLDGKNRRIVLNTLHKNIPQLQTSGKATSAGHFYLSYVYMRLIEKVDNNGRLLFYRFEPLPSIERNSTGWWDFKKHQALDGNTYYSYQEPDDKYASWRFNGFNPGKRVILDAQYNKVKEIQLEAAPHVLKGYPVDGHDFYMFTPDHYIVMSYIDRDTIINQRDTVLASAYIQEVEGGKVVFDWWSLNHGEMATMTDPCFATTAGKDYVHLNSIDVLPDGNLLCSFRHISSVLKIDRQGKNGDILWRVAGADNDGGYAFHGQHYARYHAADGTITLFNNGNGTGRTQMLRLAVDVNSGAVSQSTILLNDGYYAQACGALSFSGDNMIVGWGIPGENEANNRLLTEYDAVGNAIFTITLPTAKSQLNGVLATYRCVKCQ